MSDAAILARIEGLLEMIEEEPDDELGHFMVAVELGKVGRHAEAERHYREVLRLEPEYTAAWRGLGRCLVTLGRAQEAIPVFQRGLEVAARTGDLQTAKEMEVFLGRISRG